jgi:hypothetical protein
MSVLFAEAFRVSFRVGLGAAAGLSNPDVLDANEWTWAFVAVYGVGLEGKPQANGLEPLASEGACLNYCGRLLRWSRLVDQFVIWCICAPRFRT